jgi:hypothetical protein
MLSTLKGRAVAAGVTGLSLTVCPMVVYSLSFKLFINLL